MTHQEDLSLRWIMPALLIAGVLAAGSYLSERMHVAASAHSVLPGRIEAFRIADAKSDLSGKIEYVLVSRGAKVRQGQLLAVVDGEWRAQDMDRAAARSRTRAAARTVATQQVRAPQAGMVLSVAARSGDNVWPGLPLFRIADMTYLRVDVPLSPALAHHVSAGTPVVVRLPFDVPQQMAARVSAVGLEPNVDHQSFLAQITIPNPKPGTVIVGQKCDVEFLPAR